MSNTDNMRTFVEDEIERLLDENPDIFGVKKDNENITAFTLRRFRNTILEEAALAMNFHQYMATEAEPITGYTYKLAAEHIRSLKK